jgi:hypothetical protein
MARWTSPLEEVEQAEIAVINKTATRKNNRSLFVFENI